MFTLPYPPFTCPSGNGRDFVLQDYLYYTAKDGTKYRGIKGGTTDGASTFRAIWNIYPPFGWYWIAAVLHDLLYRGFIEMLVNDTWTRVQVDKDAADSLLKEAMESLEGCDKETIFVIYEAVKHFGNQAFIDDMKEPVTQ